jgi:leader peptidase (prepilin peptidase)/N-methyltransferase
MRETVLTVFSAAMGAVIGSFLNACIHRMPRNISLGNPKRSFCPSCQRLIPWYENLPLISWLALRGKCSGCGARISVRYFLVELLTAATFLALWLYHGLPLAPVYWLFAALLITATFIDIEHFIIPDEITWGGTAAGILLSVAVPAMMLTSSRL